MRTQKQISKAVDDLCDLVWYERKLEMFSNIQDGVENMPSKETYDQIIKAMKKIQKLTGYDGTESDFEWGMINGKLSALRWVLGEDWDFLDT